MENLVPLGTGNSRFMKSNIPASTTLAQLIQMLNNGTFPYDIGTINPAGISQQGTPLNKDTLLKDATAALYELGTDAVPDDVFEVLSNAALYEDGKFVFPSGEDIPYVSIETGSYVGTGTYGQSNPNTITFGFTPKLVFISQSNFDEFMLIVDGNTYAVPFYENGEYYSRPSASNRITFSGSQISWYIYGNPRDENATNQLNTGNQTYYYFAIGLAGGGT